ncbi:MAG: hypothetical protein HYV09_37275 [Deltaproteobacteria bacterium]|nr:hypothetical protein [Deltaproteobacteria bacterium]
MKHLPPPPRGRHPVPGTPLPPPPDRVHPAHHQFLEKPSVAPVLLDIQSDEFRSGHVLPRFPPLDALPRIAQPEEVHHPDGGPPQRGRDRRPLHLLALGAVMVFFAAIVIDRQTHSAAGSAQFVGEELVRTVDWRAVFPIQPMVVKTPAAIATAPTTGPATTGVSAVPKPAVVPPIVITAAPDVSTTAPAVVGPAPSIAPSIQAPAPPPKPKPVGTGGEPAPSEPQPDPTHGVESPGF